MARKVTARMILGRAVETLPADMVKFLIEHEGECQKLYDELNARRDDALGARTALDARLGEFTSIEAKETDLEEREGDYAARVEALATDEAEVGRRKAVLDKLNNYLQAFVRETEAQDRLRNLNLDEAT